METKHLTEEALQAFALKELVDTNIALHLSDCEDCKAKYKTYLLLVNELNAIETETFAFDASALVMQKIEPVETEKETAENTIFYIGIIAFTVAMLIYAYPMIQPLFQYFLANSVMINAFIFIVVIGVSFFLIKDLFRQYREKERLLFQ